MSDYQLDEEYYVDSLDEVRKLGRFAFAPDPENHRVVAYCPMTDSVKIGPDGASPMEAMVVLGCESCPNSMKCVGASNATLQDALSEFTMELLMKHLLGTLDGEVL